MKTTRHVDEPVRRERPYIDLSWCRDVIAAPLRRELQRDGRARYRGEVRLPREPAPRILRVVTQADGEPVHNAFFDRRFTRKQP